MAAGAPKAFLAFAILVVLSASQAHALLGVTQLVATGNLFCSPNGANTGGSPPLANVRVNLCLLNGLVVGSANTGSNGSFRIVINNLLILNGIINVQNLRVRVQLPVNACSLLSGTGSLVGNLVPQGSISDAGFLNIAVLNGAWIRVA